MTFLDDVSVRLYCLSFEREIETADQKIHVMRRPR